MKTLLQCAGTVALLSIAGFFAILTYRTARPGGFADGVDSLLSKTAKTSEQIGATAASLPETLNAVNQTLAVAVRTANNQLTAARSDIRELGTKLDAPALAISQAVTHLSGLREDLAPTLEQTRLAAQNVALTVHDSRPQILGLLGASKVAAGEVATMGREIRRATPSALAGFQAIQWSVESSARTFAVGFPIFVNNTNGITRSVDQILRPRWWETPLKAAVAGAVVAGSLK